MSTVTYWYKDWELSPLVMSTNLTKLINLSGKVLDLVLCKYIFCYQFIKNKHFRAVLPSLAIVFVRTRPLLGSLIIVVLCVTTRPPSHPLVLLLPHNSSSRDLITNTGLLTLEIPRYKWLSLEIFYLNVTRLGCFIEYQIFNG